MVWLWPLLLMSCRQPVVGIRLAFGGDAPYLLTKSVEVAAFDASLPAVAADVCRSLLTPNAPAPSSEPVETVSFDICATDAPALSLPVGRWLLIARGRGYDDSFTVGGCSIVDLFGDDETLSGDEAAFAQSVDATSVVSIDMTPLPTLPSTAPTCSLEDKCSASSC
jgi:hypothetical protein